jgi:hypothetical protein
VSTLSDDAWFGMLRRVAAGENGQVNGRPLPSMPDPAVQIRTVGQAGAGAMEEATAFAGQCLMRFRQSPRFDDPRKVLLDFGTG